MSAAAERWQLRDYTIKAGEMDQWLEEWRAKIAPLRRSLGFEVMGAWAARDDDRFIWLLRYRGDRTFEEADADYYASPDRKAISPDPARHIAHNETRFVEPIRL